jgi:hypothetical protein
VNKLNAVGGLAVLPGILMARTSDEELSLDGLMTILPSAILGLLLFFQVLISGGHAGEVSKLSLTPPHEMTRADFYSIRIAAHPRAVLVLCPGCNSSGEEMIKEAAWQKFARQHNLGVLGLYYVSDMEVLNEHRGYHFAPQGSGQVLLDAVHKIYGEDLPLVLYGVSSGAFFACQFADWRPDRVFTWCAYASGDAGEQTKLSSFPPGLIACGEYDGGRYGAMLSNFNLVRSMGKRWLLVSLPKTGHEVSPPLEDFVREYFSSVLTAPAKTADDCWLDVDCEEAVSITQAEEIPSITDWLPRRQLLTTWQRIHEP